MGLPRFVNDSQHATNCTQPCSTCMNAIEEVPSGIPVKLCCEVTHDGQRLEIYVPIDAVPGSTHRVRDSGGSVT